MSPATIGISAAVLAAGALAAFAIIAGLNAASRRIEALLADAYAYDWLAGIDDEYRALTEENA